jgi:hypothetical protein
VRKEGIIGGVHAAPDDKGTAKDATWRNLLMKLRAGYAESLLTT